MSPDDSGLVKFNNGNGGRRSTDQIRNQEKSKRSASLLDHETVKLATGGRKTIEELPTDGVANPRINDCIAMLGLVGSLSVGLPRHPWA